MHVREKNNRKGRSLTFKLKKNNLDAELPQLAAEEKNGQNKEKLDD